MQMEDQNQRRPDEFLDDSQGDRLLYDYACALYEDTLLYQAAADYKQLRQSVSVLFDSIIYALSHIILDILAITDVAHMPDQLNTRWNCQRTHVWKLHNNSRSVDINDTGEIEK